MSFRVRLTLLCVLAVAVTVVLASMVSYFAVSNRLHDQTDNSLRADTTRLAKLPNPEVALPYFGLPTPNARDYIRVTFCGRQQQVPPEPAHGHPPEPNRRGDRPGRHPGSSSGTRT